MTDKDFASKLAASMRRAKEPSATPASVPATVTTSVPVTPPPPRHARPSSQAAGTRLDNPWTNLHPTRIWPD